MQAEEIIRELPKGLLGWYPWKPGIHILQVAEGPDGVTEFLQGQGMAVTCAGTEQVVQEEFCAVHAHEFDAVAAVSVLEKTQQPQRVLCRFRKLLKEDGRLLLGTDNRFGFRYFCGDRDPYTGRNFDGIENYRRAELMVENRWQGRCYARFEIEEMLAAAGFGSRKFYAVLPDLEHPQLIFSESYRPKEELATRYFPFYHEPDTLFLEEEAIYTDLIKNGMLGQIANTYLIECCLSGDFAKADQVTVSIDRGREYALMTVVCNDGRVEKRAVYPEGRERLLRLLEHTNDLKAHGLAVVEGRMEGDAYVMPYVEGEVALVHLRNLLYENKELFIAEMDRFRGLIMQSSEIEETEEGAIFRKGYFDLVPLNCFYTKAGYVFYDQEFCVENYPVNVIMMRMVDLTYLNDIKMEKILPREILLKRYGLWEQADKWRRASSEFLKKLRNEKELKIFYERHRRNLEIVNSNRQRMNYSTGEYQRLFVNIFDNIGGRKLILFGSGNFTKKFVEVYAKDYPVSLIVDNNPRKWDTKMYGIPVVSPSVLGEMQPHEFKVIVCIKNYMAVMRQLRGMGITDFGIFDTNMDYPRKKAGNSESGIIGLGNQQDTTPKKYHTGYIAGVFDLFHVGHLNMFKRAKEQCDYLIVGVVSDEGVRKNKRTETFVPFEERIELVRSCRYVDEAVEIPLNYAGTRDAYRLYHFDCQFSGSDYVDNPDWLAEKAFLEKNGAEMVFFPYTRSTSSTKLKAAIEKKIEVDKKK